MRARERDAILGATAAAATCVVVSCAGVAASQATAPERVVALLALACVPYAALARYAIALPPRAVVRVAVALAALTGVGLVAAPPTLSDDVFRYLWDARVLRAGIDPYAYAPDAPELAALRDPLHALINHAHLRTIYPPVAQLVFVVADLVAHAPWSMKLVMLGGHLATIPLVARLAGAEPQRATMLFALSPLALSSCALDGHVDSLAGLAVAAFVLAANRVPVAGAIAVAVASGLKLVGLPLLPLLRRRALGVGLLLSLVVLAPLAQGGAGRSSGLGAYARDWRGNEGLFAIVAEAGRWAFEGVGRVSGAPGGWVRLDAIAPAIDALSGTPLDPRGARDPKKAIARPYSFETRQLGGLLARVAVGLAVLWIAIRSRDASPTDAARRTLFAMLLLAPQVHPWYLLWILPLECAALGPAGLAWSVAILVGYLRDDVGLTRTLEHVLVLGILAASVRSRRGARFVT